MSCSECRDAFLLEGKDFNKNVAVNHCKVDSIKLILKRCVLKSFVKLHTLQM